MNNFLTRNVWQIIDLEIWMFTVSWESKIMSKFNIRRKLNWTHKTKNRSISIKPFKFNLIHTFMLPGYQNFLLIIFCKRKPYINIFSLVRNKKRDEVTNLNKTIIELFPYFLVHPSTSCHNENSGIFLDPKMKKREDISKFHIFMAYSLFWSCKA